MSLRFQNSEIAFEVPEGWEDRSTTSFVFPEAASSVTLTAGVMGASATLDSCAKTVLAQLATVLPGIALVDCRRVAVGINPGAELTVEWEHASITLRNVITLVLVEGTLWSLTASTPKGELTRTEDVIARAMESFAVVEPKKIASPHLAEPSMAMHPSAMLRLSSQPVLIR